MNFFQKFKEMKGKDENASLDGIILEPNDPREKEILRAIADGADVKGITKKGRKQDSEEFASIMMRLGYGICCQSYGGIWETQFSITKLCSPEFMVVRYVNKHYDELMEKVFEEEKISEDSVHLFLALVKNKKTELTAEEKGYLTRAIAKQNSGADYFRLCKGIVEEVNELAEKLGLAKAVYNTSLGDNDFKVNFADIDNDAKHRAELLTELINKNPLRNVSTLYANAYELVLSATIHCNRWYNVRRDPLVHYYVLKEYPNNFKLPRDFVDFHLGICEKPERTFDYGDDKIIAAAIIDRAYRVEAKKPKLEI